MGLIVIPESEQCLTVQQGVFEVERKDAVIRCAGVRAGMGCEAFGCQGIRVRDLPLSARTLQAHFARVGGLFRSRLAARGYEPLGDELWLHGPFASYDYATTMVDGNDSAFTDAQRLDPTYAIGVSPGDYHPELTLPFVHERGASPMVDYVFLGYFLAPELTTRVLNTATTDRSVVETTGIAR